MEAPLHSGCGHAQSRRPRPRGACTRASMRVPPHLERGRPFLSTGHPPEELLPGPLLNSRHLHQPRLQRPIHILGPPRNQQQLAPSHVPCPPPAARADRAQPPEPHTSPAAHQAGAAQAPDSAPPPQAPAATGSGGLKVTTHALHMSDHCIHLFLRRLARPALNSRAH